MIIIKGDRNISGVRPAVIVSRFNSNLTDVYLKETLNTLKGAGIMDESITVVHVPGSFEIPTVIELLNERINPDGFICLGVIIRGETIHHKVISDAVASRILELNQTIKKPIVFGIVNAEDYEQALARISPDKMNRGEGMAGNLLEMIDVYRRINSLSL